MTTALANGHAPAELLEKVLLQGDLEQLNPTERLAYYQRVCESLGFNPLTRPFDYIKLNGKLTLYAKRDATDQLRKNNNVSVTIVGREKLDDVYVVTARATMPDGRTDESIGAVAIANLKGEVLANALMKAETKSKRRVTLSICGLGTLDETEVDSVPDAERVTVSPSGELVREIRFPAQMPAKTAIPVHSKEDLAAARAVSDAMRRMGLDETAFKQRMKIDPRESIREWGSRIGWDKAQAEAEGHEAFLQENQEIEGLPS